MTMCQTTCIFGRIHWLIFDDFSNAHTLIFSPRKWRAQTKKNNSKFGSCIEISNPKTYQRGPFRPKQEPLKGPIPCNFIKYDKLVMVHRQDSTVLCMWKRSRLVLVPARCRAHHEDPTWAAMYASHSRECGHSAQCTVAVLTLLHQQTLAGRHGRWRLISSHLISSSGKFTDQTKSDGNRRLMPDRLPTCTMMKRREGLWKESSKCFSLPFVWAWATHFNVSTKSACAPDVRRRGRDGQSIGSATQKVQDLQDTPWRDGELRGLEEGLPRLKEEDPEKATRGYKSATGGGM